MGINLTLEAHKRSTTFFDGKRLDFVVDATVGNGHDALFLLSLLNDGGKLFGFDVQKSAIDSSSALLEKKSNVASFELFLSGHEDMESRLPANSIGKIGCVFFNLGWLPRSDKRVTTNSQTTLRALEVSLKVLDKNLGYISVLCYRGHEGGEAEYRAVLDFFEKNFGDSFAKVGDESNALSPILLAVGFKENKLQKSV